MSEALHGKEKESKLSCLLHCPLPFRSVPPFSCPPLDSVSPINQKLQSRVEPCCSLPTKGPPLAHLSGHDMTLWAQLTGHNAGTTFSLSYGQIEGVHRPPGWTMIPHFRKQLFSEEKSLHSAVYYTERQGYPGNSPLYLLF